ncbi:MAG: YihY/virulence factor BrkB family protein [Planctomycetes bacterium]|nr:YihY/virulence factor BrkB family protein [Planctomycetota bacterium]
MKRVEAIRPESNNKPMSIKHIIRMLWQTLNGFFANNGFQIAAALSYYTLLSLAPLTLVALVIAGIWWDRAAASDAMLEEMNRFMGAAGVDVLKTILSSAGQSDKTLTLGLTSLATLVFGASAVFLSLHDAMNFIWKVEARKGRRFSFLRRRIISTLMMGILGLVLICSLPGQCRLHGSTGIPDRGWVGDLLPWAAMNQGLSCLTSGLLFAALYKFLPDVRLRWGVVFWSALGAGALFSLGKYVFGSYLGKWDISHAYGAAGTVIVFLIWVYYSALILYFGAQFTHARMMALNRSVLPAPHAKWKNPVAHGPTAD